MENNQKELIIVTGVSGAGKSSAVGFLEDAGYYCIDNMPPLLLATFLELLSKNGAQNKIAVVVDIRSTENFESVIAVVDNACGDNYNVKIVYLDASTSVVLKRYKLTRRKHPYSDRFNGDISRALSFERETLAPFRLRADYIIDTSDMQSNQLRNRLTELILGSEKNAINIHVMSFGFKHGIPTEADFVLDVRCLPNPFWIEELKDKTGLDREVADYVFSFEESKILMDKLLDMLSFLTPLYIKEGKSQLVFAIGCTGGNHRSVAIAEKIKNHFEKSYKNVSVNHRDISKK